MSLETEVKKLAAAQVQNTDAIVQLTTILEAYVFSTSGSRNVKTPVSSTISETQAPADPAKPEPVVEVPTAQPTVPTHTVPAPTASAYSLENVNEILGGIAGRMNDNGVAVRALMAEYGASVIMALPQDKYGEIIGRAQGLVES